MSDEEVWSEKNQMPILSIACPWVSMSIHFCMAERTCSVYC